ncbi:MAG: ADP-ribosylglycohydrolase family protein [Clostridia bacterium]|nr:ADP-ribosylglycohydrolase family protein [Clostridia bacterium]
MKNIPVDFKNSLVGWWGDYAGELMTEYQQSCEEGLDIASYENLFKEVSKLPSTEAKAKLADGLFHLIYNADMVDGYEHNEPSDLETIKSLRKKTLPPLNFTKIDKKKIEGAWYGRIAGCLLGKPIEGIRYDGLTAFLKATNNYPMSRYIKYKELTPELCKIAGYELLHNGKKNWYIDNLEFAPVDDDTNYVVMNCLVADWFGRDFTPMQMADTWLKLQPKEAYCTAERVAFANFIRGYNPPYSAVYKNPYREWIGAQIRGDYFGYCNPGDTETAAKMAFNDACISHVKNGIYGEMWASATIAAAAVCNDPRLAILYGMEEIPATSRLYKALAKAVENYDNGMTEEEWFNDFHSRWDDRNSHHWCHTISNAEICAASILYGKGDFAKSICIAVQNGFDTDCNGATVGSICGIMNGIDGIGKEWYEDFNGTLATSLCSYPRVSLDEYVEKTMKHIEER